MMERQKKQELKDIFSEIKDKYKNLSKSHKKIAAFVIENYEKAPDMSAIKIAQNVHVSEATVVRFALSLGYEGYPEFRRALKNEINSKLTTVERIDMSVDQNVKGKVFQRLATQVLKNDAESIIETLRNFDHDAFCKSVELIRNADRVIIIGFRTTSLLADYLGHYLYPLLDDVRIINQSVTDVYEHLVKIGENDVVIGMSFPRYAQKTYETIRFLKDRGPKIITISDNEHAPLNEFADYKLIVKSNVCSFVDSLSAPLSLLNTLAVAVGLQNVKETKRTFNELEEIWKENDIYTGDDFEMNFQEK